MTRISRLKKAAVLVVAVTAILTVAGLNAEAKFKPFKIVGVGVGPDGIPLPGQPARFHWAIGHATELGKYFGEGEVQTDSATFLPDGSVVGEFGSAVPFVFFGEDGDQLACYYGRTEFGAKEPGTFTLVPHPELGEGVYQAFWVAEFVPFLDECTGKFAGVGGSWIMYAQSAPFVLGSTDPVAYAWHGEGELDFAKGK
jgi:hypothetical protein